VSIVLADTGIGFTDAQLEKVFEPFQTGFANGTGLGLAIAYQILEAHRGTIQVGSTPGKGSRFLIELPRERNWESVNREESQIQHKDDVP
jgi:signal transduction histidine kinase